MPIRWQDWASAVSGLWLVISPWEMSYTLDNAARGNACGVGAVLVVFNLVSACRLKDQGQEIFNILLGVWLILSPYSLGFSDDDGPTINAVATGLTVVILAVWQFHDAANGKVRNK